MTRFSSLLLAGSLAILPVAAFAQPNAAPAKTAVTDPAPVTAPMATGSTTTGAMARTPTANSSLAQPSAPVTHMSKTDVKTPNAGVKTSNPGVRTAVSTKDTKSAHAKLGATVPATPAKTAEPGKS